MVSEKKSYTVNEIRDKMAKYCAYQDRCQWEVEQKFYDFNLIPEARDEIMIYLIQQNFLNEERFAKSFARGKFYQKNWGRIKIRIELKKRKIPEKLIQVGLNEIDEKDYLTTLNQLFEKKKASLKSERESFKKKAKIRNYLLQKGFESEFITDLIR
ncbi:regulatory protein RecX [Moheibacter lacus]|uniref:Regulatory protein RecX n=1 Tax=Moheibacter lacus TaxID=2745851 RepID=A0A838ZNI9_9FLAO|nr:regulatory protein RecX [Moheibacter lacus]MBA5628817.1 RecX family transcriptional regulator [Moheibacter lacus]